ncbi:MAG: S-layer homology domain-containing protein [Bacteroidetes bacterium]|nr:S-layer homology domain-containing protein [Bacteroidota bacterium]MBU1718365.1 S-layer homology domain-containing protein [Bacteroidota bacterium]
MKKILFALILTLSFITISSASSGACSNHDGVNCEIGPDTDGSVICNDEWKGSVIYYKDVKNVCNDNFAELLFYDVAKYTPYYESIKFVKAEGIVDGYDNGFYRPDFNINRAEYTKILIGAMRAYSPDNYPTDEELEAAVPNNGCFPDTKKDDWYSKYVCHAKSIGYIDGYPDGTFGPSNNINIVEAMKIVFEARDYEGINQQDDGTWYNKYTMYADDNNLWVNSWLSLPPEYAITRGEMAEFIQKSVFRE